MCGYWINWIFWKFWIFWIIFELLARAGRRERVAPQEQEPLVWELQQVSPQAEQQERVEPQEQAEQRELRLEREREPLQEQAGRLELPLV